MAATRLPGKPLLKIGNQTLLSNTLKFLKLFGIKKVIINVHYLKNQIIVCPCRYTRDIYIYIYIYIYIHDNVSIF